MNLKEIFDTAKAQPLLLDLLPNADNGGKICPHHDCDGGRGKSKTGATKFILPNGQERLGCFKCKSAGRNGNFSNVDIAAYHLGITVSGAAYTGSDALNIAKFLAAHFCWQFDGVETSADFSLPPAKTSALDTYELKAEIAKIIAADIERYRKNPTPVPAKYARGISQATFEKYGVVFVEDWTPPRDRTAEKKNHTPTPRKAFLFICGSSYVARLADKIEDYPADKQKYIHRVENAGAVEIFNAKAIDEAAEGSTIYAVEGIFDALSLLQIGAENVVAINGAPHWKKLVERIKARADGGKSLRVAILFDDDSAGRQSAENTRQTLLGAGVPAITRFLPRVEKDTSDEKVDANYVLQKFGADWLGVSFFRALTGDHEEFAASEEEIKSGKFEGLKSPVDTQIPKTTEMPENDALSASTGKSEAGNRADFDLQNEDEYFQQDFEANVERRRKFANRKTGFANLDECQIFTPGLYVLGGLPSIGKTSFAWQLADNLATAGEPVFYVSYEMSVAQLRAKSIARRVYQADQNSRLSSAQIAIGGWNRTVDTVVAELKNSKRIFYTLQANGEHSAEKLIALMDRFCATLDKPPVVFVDYLQRMPRTLKMDLREGVGKNAYALKNWQLKSGATVIALSSFNRDNYSAPVSFESFKETGEIEYSADVMWGLQLYCVNRATGKVTADREMFADAKKRQPREMQLVCVKNREGNIYDCYFKYQSAVDSFLTCEEEDFDGGDIAEPPEPSQTVGAKQRKHQDLD